MHMGTHHGNLSPRKPTCAGCVGGVGLCEGDGTGSGVHVVSVGSVQTLMFKYICCLFVSLADVLLPALAGWMLEMS